MAKKEVKIKWKRDLHLLEIILQTLRIKKIGLMK